MRYILLLRQDLVIGAFDEELIQGHWHTNEDVLMLLLDGDQLDLSVVLGDLVRGQKIHEVEAKHCIHLLRIRDELAELLIVVSSQDAHMLLILLNVLLLNAEECGILVYLSCENALFCLRLKAWRYVLKESELILQLLYQLVSLPESSMSLLQ